jgi:hypothetical protein
MDIRLLGGAVVAVRWLKVNRRAKSSGGILAEPPALLALL